ncbi:MAG: NADH-quinone oxidoreductase subunit J [Dehalococcoidia bacterium]
MEGFGAGFAFWVLAATVAVAAGGVMLARSTFHAMLFLVLAFVAVAGFFVLLSADFLAMAQIIIYVGAIAVLMLFAILLTPRAARDNGETWMALPALLLGLGLAALMLFVIFDTTWAEAAEPPAIGIREIGDALLSTWALPFELASVLLTAALVGSILLARSTEEDREDRV